MQRSLRQVLCQDRLRVRLVLVWGGAGGGGGGSGRPVISNLLTRVNLMQPKGELGDAVELGVDKR